MEEFVWRGGSLQSGVEFPTGESCSFLSISFSLPTSFPLYSSLSFCFLIFPHYSSFISFHPHTVSVSSYPSNLSLSTSLPLFLLLNPFITQRKTKARTHAHTQIPYTHVCTHTQARTPRPANQKPRRSSAQMTSRELSFPNRRRTLTPRKMITQTTRNASQVIQDKDRGKKTCVFDVQSR